MSVSVSLLRPLALELTRHRIDPWSVLAEIGVSAEKLADAREVISARAFEAWLTRALKLADDPAFGLRAGTSAPLASLIGIGPLMQACTDLREALAMFLRYAGAFGHCAHWTFKETGPSAQLSFSISRPPGSLSTVLDDFVMGMVYRALRAFVPGADMPSSAVRFTHAPPRYADAYRSAFACPVQFGADSCTLLFPSARLDEPNPYADPIMRGVFAEFIELVLQQRRGRNCADRVRFAIRHGLVQDRLDVRSVASAVGLSPRALRRKLQGDGTNASSVIGQERERFAYRELARRDTSIKEISQELGFSEPSSFHRAFKRWSGVTPAQFKRAILTTNEAPAHAGEHSAR